MTAGDRAGARHRSRDDVVAGSAGARRAPDRDRTTAPPATGPVDRGVPEERPPLGSWTRLYALVLAALGIDVVLLWLLTRAFG
jgi:hypothetical protein